MPRGNRTGPEGRGPMTGRGVGYCGGYDMPGNANPVGGRGYGRGQGRGQSIRYWQDDNYPDPYYPRHAPVYQELAPEEEKAYLENLVKGIEKELGAIKARIKELVKKDK